MGDGTTPGCLARSMSAIEAGAVPEASAGWWVVGNVAAMVTLRATRTRKPARSISISVKLVSSSNSASSRISALSPALSLDRGVAALSLGWRAMLEIRVIVEAVFRASRVGLGVRLDRADPGRKAADGEPITVDAEAAQGGERGTCNEGVVTEAFPRIDVADVNFHSGDLHRHQGVMERDGRVRVAAGVDDNAPGLLRARLVHEVDQRALAAGLPAVGDQAETRGGCLAQRVHVG